MRKLLLQSVTAEATWQFENVVEDRLCKLGRNILETVYNRLGAGEMPKQVEYDRQQYNCKNEKTPNRGGIGTVFGEISLVRFSYKPLSEARDDNQKSVLSLKLSLGLVSGNTTPTLSERVGRTAAGQPQCKLLEFLEREHQVRWSAKVLQRAADDSKGRRKIMLAVGRDGIMLTIRGEETYKEGAVGTVTVYDRHGRRLGTIYLGQMPEAYQTTLSKELTRLVAELLKEWDGRWPRLVYITDAGYLPTEYFDNVLTQMKHLRHPGRLLEWIRIVDFYHATEYLAKLVQVLFDDPRAAHA